ncbi:putative flavoprotein involved in K+ transport [Mycolicibacterium rhodesiae NBB3]|uniref:Putative flavoprotein involved in K+ transport n=1 Tax=Mycolicibacterium rhodesiae (strain NBB3) TaxID=710685 RepID=G8RWY6_MYCRN|nr:putative flavoprotein involved in K+ transport [Mycolicibacterium rhodesiae NBB3]
MKSDFATARRACDPSIVIIGAGFAGVAMAHRLKKDGFTNFTILEKAADIGGVWRDNTYPGAACDVPSALYSLSHKPNPRWSRRYAEQPEILQDLCGLVESGGLDAHLRTHTEVVDMTFDEQSGRWTLATSSNETICCDVVVSAVGQLSLPHIPDIADADAFQGPRFHSARWDRSVSLRGKQVAVIGTGASAIQFVPHIAREAAHVTLYQRTAPWILPKWDSRYGVLHHRLSEFLPVLLHLERFAVWLIFEMLAVMLVDAKPLSRVLGAIARRHLHRQVASPSLREQLTLSDAPGCKRVLFSNDYYPAIASDRVSLVPERDRKALRQGCQYRGRRISSCRCRDLRNRVSRHRFSRPDVRARLSRSLLGRGVGDPGIRISGHHCVPMFPNLFLLYGPNTNVGSGSILYMIESQLRHIATLIKVVAAHPGHAIDVKSEIAQRYNTRLRRRLRRSVWALCASWYRTSSGEIPTNWPGPTLVYRLLTRKPRSSDYVLRKVGRLQVSGPSCTEPDASSG